MVLCDKINILAKSISQKIKHCCFSYASFRRYFCSKKRLTSCLRPKNSFILCCSNTCTYCPYFRTILFQNIALDSGALQHGPIWINTFEFSCLHNTVGSEWWYSDFSKHCCRRHEVLGTFKLPGVKLMFSSC